MPKKKEVKLDFFTMLDNIIAECEASGVDRSDILSDMETKVNDLREEE